MAVTATVRAVEFPLCLTVAAVDEINARCGGLNALSAFLRGDPEDTDGMTPEEKESALAAAACRARVNNAWMLGLLIREGEENRRIEAAFSGGDTAPRRVPDEREMLHLLTPGQAEGYYLPVLLAVNEGMRRTIEAQSLKNGMQAGQA